MVTKLPIEDVLELHTFNPKEISDLLEDYFIECINHNIFSVRIIHGKGKGILKKKVQSILRKNSLVVFYKNAPESAGAWGATIVDLQQKRDIN